MSEPFHKRFDIEVPIEEARRRFVNRMREFTEMAIDSCKQFPRSMIMQAIKIHLGEKQGYFRDERAAEFMRHWDAFVKEDYLNCLRITEATYLALIKFREDAAGTFHKYIESALQRTETDLEICWDGGFFKRKGAALLDEKLVNDPLHWLRDYEAYQNVLLSFEKGLKHFTEAMNSPDRYGDVITDMYESLEAMAKAVTGSDTDLSGNRELFISRLRLPDAYKKMLKEYIDFANDYRHAPDSGQRRANPSPKDTEAFVYMTGLFIRLAVQSLS